MPLTPFHFGPGAASKGLLPRHFSFTVFALSQVIIDSEVVILLLARRYPIHGFFHTYAGALVVGILSTMIGRRVGSRLKVLWNRNLDPRMMEWATVPVEISLVAAAVGAFTGTFSHVLLDSFMHPDMAPLAPLSAANPLLGRISFVSLHLMCTACGLLGGLLYLARLRCERGRRRRTVRSGRL
jgi:hypothetical protein